jgi:hypothetical protein
MYNIKGGEKTEKKQSTEGGSEMCPQCGRVLPSRREPIRLRELAIVGGKLCDLVEPDDEDIALAKIEDLLVEVPRSLVGPMWEPIGKRIWLAKVGGKIRAA